MDTSTSQLETTSAQPLSTPSLVTKEVKIANGDKVTLKTEVKGRDLKRLMDFQETVNDKSKRTDFMVGLVIQKVNGVDMTEEQVPAYTDDLDGKSYIALINAVESLNFL